MSLYLKGRELTPAEVEEWKMKTLNRRNPEDIEFVKRLYFSKMAKEFPDAEIEDLRSQAAHMKDKYFGHSNWPSQWSIEFLEIKEKQGLFELILGGLVDEDS